MPFIPLAKTYNPTWNHFLIEEKKVKTKSKANQANCFVLLDHVHFTPLISAIKIFKERLNYMFVCKKEKQKLAKTISFQMTRLYFEPQLLKLRAVSKHF